MFSERYIMVTGGSPDPQARLTEVIDIIDPTRTCATLQEFPENLVWGVGGAIMNGSLIRCSIYHCYKYENDAWSQFSTFGAGNGDLWEGVDIVLKGKKVKMLKDIKNYKTYRRL